MNYDQTLNLPSTDFPMRGNLPQREPEIQKYWRDNRIYHRLLEKNREKKSFILHDGPPYANGHIHTGHALNKTLKDIIIKFRNMQGITGRWCTVGLPMFAHRATGD